MLSEKSKVQNSMYATLGERKNKEKIRKCAYVYLYDKRKLRKDKPENNDYQWGTGGENGVDRIHKGGGTSLSISFYNGFDFWKHVKILHIKK